ncbi:MAG: acyl-CoA dehydrogenase family protein [Actinomycetota bacterium]|nr:acyl-CoA dehydrogenase family protein [Actinomycetota bacterium]
MDLMPSAEQDEITTTVASFLAARLPATAHASVFVTPGPEIDPVVFRECAELGWLSLGLPEALGGVGYGLAEEVMLFRELGRGLAPGGFLPAVLGARVAAFAGQRELAASIVAGEVLVALATRDRVGADDVSVLHAAEATLLVVCDAAGAALYSLADCTLTPIDPVDGSIRAARGALGGATVASVSSEIDPVFVRGLVLCAAMQAGSAEAQRDLGVAYAGVREQFGKPIGANQAIKHRCADMAVRAEGAFAQVCYAATAADGGADRFVDEAVIAKYFADEAARLNGEACVQIHGAIGFTTETLPHRHVWRAHTLARALAVRAALLDHLVPRT